MMPPHRASQLGDLGQTPFLFRSVLDSVTIFLIFPYRIPVVFTAELAQPFGRSTDEDAVARQRRWPPAADAAAIPDTFCFKSKAGFNI